MLRSPSFFMRQRMMASISFWMSTAYTLPLGPTSRAISLPLRSMMSVVGMPTALSAANSLPEGSV